MGGEKLEGEGLVHPSIEKALQKGAKIGYGKVHGEGNRKAPGIQETCAHQE